MISLGKYANTTKNVGHGLRNFAALLCKSKATLVAKAQNTPNKLFNFKKVCPNSRQDLFNPRPDFITFSCTSARNELDELTARWPMARTKTKTVKLGAAALLF